MKTHHAAPTIEQNWNPSIPPSNLRNAKLQLLTIGGVCVHGVWLGQLGQYYTAWCPLLKVTPYVKELAKAAIESHQNHHEHYEQL